MHELVFEVVIAGRGIGARALEGCGGMRSGRASERRWKRRRRGEGSETGGCEGQRLWDWFCFLYVSDVLRLPAPPPAPRLAPAATQRVIRREILGL